MSLTAAILYTLIVVAVLGGYTVLLKKLFSPKQVGSPKKLAGEEPVPILVRISTVYSTYDPSGVLLARTENQLEEEYTGPYIKVSTTELAIESLNVIPQPLLRGIYNYDLLDVTIDDVIGWTSFFNQYGQTYKHEISRESLSGQAQKAMPDGISKISTLIKGDLNNLELQHFNEDINVQIDIYIEDTAGNSIGSKSLISIDAQNKTSDFWQENMPMEFEDNLKRDPFYVKEEMSI